MRLWILTALLATHPGMAAADDNINYFSGGNHISINGRVIQSGEIVEGSGREGSETRQLEAFGAIILIGPIDAEIRVGGEPRLILTADDNLLPLILSRVEDGQLTLDLVKSVSSRHRIEARISTPRLEALDITGSGDTLLELPDEEHLAIQLLGSGDLEARGRVRRLDIEITGAGDLDAMKLEAEQVHLTLTGAGDAEITARKEIDLTLLGTGDVTVHGNPSARRVSSLSIGEVEFE